MTTINVFSNVRYVNSLSRIEREAHVLMFSALEVDFTRGLLAPGEYDLHIVALFSAVTLRFPSDVAIRVDSVNLLGNAPQSIELAAARARVRLHVYSIFSDVRVIPVARPVVPPLTQPYYGETQKLYDPIRP